VRDARVETDTPADEDRLAGCDMDADDVAESAALWLAAPVDVEVSVAILETEAKEVVDAVAQVETDDVPQGDTEEDDRCDAESLLLTETEARGDLE
jgi:hypothetical protein